MERRDRGNKMDFVSDLVLALAITMPIAAVALFVVLTLGYMVCM